MTTQLTITEVLELEEGVTMSVLHNPNHTLRIEVVRYPDYYTVDAMPVAENHYTDIPKQVAYEALDAAYPSNWVGVLYRSGWYEMDSQNSGSGHFSTNSQHECWEDQ